MRLDNRDSQRRNTPVNKSGNESWIKYSDESKTQEIRSERNGERKEKIDTEQNNSNSELSTKSPWLSRENQPAFHSPCAAYLNSRGEGNVIGMFKWCCMKL